jgi:hypothetical protein
MIPGMDREHVVRTAFERFNENGFAGTLKLFDTDARVSDLLRPSTVMLGRDAVLLQWTRRFDQARAETLVADIVGLGDTVLAAVCFQVYTPDEVPVGSPFIVASRFAFDEHRIIGLTHRTFNTVQDDVKALLHVH